MSGIYNVDRNDRTGIVEVTVCDRDGMPIEAFIDAIRAAARGLQDPVVSAEVETFYDDTTVEITVSGRRRLTDAEFAEWERRFRPNAEQRVDTLYQSLSVEERQALAKRLSDLYGSSIDRPVWREAGDDDLRS